MRYEQEGDMYRRRARGRLIQIQRLSYPFVREGRPVLTTYLLPLYEATALYPSPPLCLGAAVCAAPRSGAAHPATHNAPTVRASNMNPGKFGAGGGQCRGLSVGLLGEGFVCVRARASVCVWPAITVCTHLKSSRIRHVRWTRGTSVLSSVPRNIGAVHEARGRARTASAPL